MKSSFNFLKADIIVQRIFFVFYLLAILNIVFQPSSFLLILILHFFVGLWQFISCVLHLSMGDGLVRKNYFLSVIFYFLLFGFFAALDSSNFLVNSDTLFIVGIGVLPMGLASWYFIITTRAYQESKKNGIPAHSTAPEFENKILDENIWE